MIQAACAAFAAFTGKPRASGDDPLTGRPLRIIDP